MEGDTEMIIDDALERVKRDRPGESTEEEQLTWLGQLDAAWLDEVVSAHELNEGETIPESFAGYADASGSEELLIPLPDDEIYIYWLYAKIDYRLGEMERYNNDMAMFNTMWDQAAKRWHRAHMPLSGVLRHVVYGHRTSAGAADDPLNQRGDWTRS